MQAGSAGLHRCEVLPDDLQGLGVFLGRAELDHLGAGLDRGNVPLCETFAENPALVRVRQSVELDDPSEALRETIADTMGFWASDDSILRQLYGVAAVDQAADDLVERQRRDRRGEMQKLVRRLDEERALRNGLERSAALAQLLVLTSYGTYRELREEGLSDARLTAKVQEMASSLLLRSS
jgi:hypothetical protein